MDFEPSKAYTIAFKEFRNSMRNRLVIGILLIMTILALAISYFGAAPGGRVGFVGFDVAVVSLISLSIYLVPIIALTLGYDTIVGEFEGKTLELLLTMPLNRLEIYLGKFLGLAMTLLVSIGGGLGLAGLLMVWKIGIERVGDYLFFILSTVLLGVSFLGIGLMVSAMVRERSKAVGWVIFIWFFFVLIFDLLLIGLLVWTEGRIGAGLFGLLLYLNPADVFRLINLTTIEGVKAAYGLATLVEGSVSIPLLYTVQLLWIVLPFLAGLLFFIRRSY